MSTQNDKELIHAINRNTRATRAIAITLVGWLPGLMVGAVVAGVGFLSAPTDPFYGQFIIAFGVLIFAVSALIAFWMAWIELRLSSFNSTPESNEGSPMESNATPSAKNWWKE